MSKKVLFRADASSEIGYGHFIRTLALADMLKDEFDCVFYTQSPSNYQLEEAKEVCPIEYLPDNDKKLSLFLDRLRGDEIVVLDNYFFTSEYQETIKSKGCKLVCIDDLHDKHYYADIVINHGCNDASLFDVEPYTRLCLGFDWALLRKSFRSPLIENKSRDGIVICYGGADPLGLAEKTIESVHRIDPKQKIYLIAGDTFMNRNIQDPNVIVKRKLSSSEVCALFDSALLGIFSSSTVAIEAASRNLWMLTGYYIDNQKSIYNTLIEYHYGYPLGDITKLSYETLEKGMKSRCSGNPPSFNAEIIQSRYIDIFNPISVA